MSRSISVDCEWFDQPAARDLVERRTWGSLRISAAGRSVTRWWDRAAQAERTGIDIPVFALAEWLVANWWALLYEPSRSEDIPPPSIDLWPSQRAWLRRHCLRGADSGLMLPRVCLYNDGRGLGVFWSADDQDAYPHMPGYFVEFGLVSVPREEVRRDLSEFVAKVLSRVEDLADERVKNLRENWNAILGADAAESAFCCAAGRMGLDPYDSESWDRALLDLIESQIGDDPDTPLVADFLESAEIRTAPEAWKWIVHAEESLGLAEAPRSVALARHCGDAATCGYDLARQVRAQAGLGEHQALRNVSDASNALGIESFAFVEHNHLPTRRFNAAVGWRDNREAVIAGPRPPRDGDRRFLEARGLYHAAVACDRGPRLVTKAHTWDQQVSRAFAAELLAPSAALVARTEPRENDMGSLIQTLADEYAVSTRVIEHQLENAGIDIDSE